MNARTLMIGGAIGLAACSDTVAPASELTLTIVGPAAGDSHYDLDLLTLVGEASAPDLGVLPDDSVWWTDNGDMIAVGPVAETRAHAGDRTITLHARYNDRTGSASRTIHVAAEGLGRILWTVPLDTNPWDAVSLGPDVTLYVVDDPDNGSAVAVAPDGTVRWRTQLGVTIMGHPPAIGPDGTLYWGHAGASGGVVAVTPDGTLQWNFLTQDHGLPGSGNYHVHGGVAIDAAGNIYFVSEERDAPMYSLRPDGSMRWRTGTRADGSTKFWGHTVLVGDSLAVAIQRDDSTVAIATSTGALRWAVPSHIFGASFCQIVPAVGEDGKIYLPQRGPGFAAVDPAGQMLWAFDLRADEPGSHVSHGSPLVGPAGLIVGYQTGGFATIDRAGTSANAMGPGPSGTAGNVTIGANGVVYVAANDSLYSFTATGVRRFATPISHAVSDCGRAQGGPVIGDDGTVYFRASATGLIAIRDTVGPATGAAWQTLQGNFQRTGRRATDQ